MQRYTWWEPPRHGWGSLSSILAGMEPVRGRRCREVWEIVDGALPGAVCSPWDVVGAGLLWHHCSQQVKGSSAGVLLCWWVQRGTRQVWPVS